MSEATIDFAVIEMLRGLRMDGDADPLVELSETFVVESAGSMRLRRAAHIIKGMSATVGALRLRPPLPA
jgi:hypothetical protein